MEAGRPGRQRHDRIGRRRSRSRPRGRARSVGGASHVDLGGSLFTAPNRVTFFTCSSRLHGRHLAHRLAPDWRQDRPVSVHGVRDEGRRARGRKRRRCRGDPCEPDDFRREAAFTARVPPAEGQSPHRARFPGVAMLPAMLEHNRRRAGWSMGQVAWRFAVSIREYRELESGAQSPNFETWDGICREKGWPQTFG